MRKTTTFRSSLVALAVAGSLLPAATVQAQDTNPASGVLQTPTVHRVVEGETLWGLAVQYLGDPYLWPQIYRMNTLVVEDPHWIFPGEELRLEPLAETEGDPGLIEVEAGVIEQEEMLPVEEEVAPPTPVAPPPPPTENTPTVFLPRGNEGRRRVASLGESARSSGYANVGQPHGIIFGPDLQRNRDTCAGICGIPNW